MRNSPTLFERRIMACLADRQTLSFNELRSAADAPNDRTLSRTLARLRRRGRIGRRVIPSTPPRTSYRLPDESANDKKS
jgi:DNA-binding HxlR family transcriptional regulator